RTTRRGCGAQGSAAGRQRSPSRARILSMHMLGNDRRPGVTRWFLALVGIAVTVTSFVRLVEVDNRAAEAWPWWFFGLIGATLTVLALGSPGAHRRADDDEYAPGARTPRRSPRARA